MRASHRLKRKYKAVNEITGETFEFTYTTVNNVIKFGLAKSEVPAGQYKIYQTWPSASGCLRTAYKRV